MDYIIYLFIIVSILYMIITGTIAAWTHRYQFEMYIAFIKTTLTRLNKTNNNNSVKITKKGNIKFFEYTTDTGITYTIPIKTSRKLFPRDIEIKYNESDIKCFRLPANVLFDFNCEDFGCELIKIGTGNNVETIYASR